MERRNEIKRDTIHDQFTRERELPAPLPVTRFHLNRAIPLERSTARIDLAKRNQTRPENQVQKRMDEKRNTGMGNIVEKYTLGGE